MKRGSIALPLSLTLAAATAGLLSLGDASSVPSTTGTAEEAACRHVSSLTFDAVAPKIVTSNADAIGAFIWANDVRYRVHYLEWGIQFDGGIGYATLMAEGEDGSFIDYHQPQNYVKVITSPAEMVGMFMTDGQTGVRYKLETVQYVVHPDGHLGVHSWSGLSETGRRASLNLETPFTAALNTEGPPCCGLRSTSACKPGTCGALCPGPTSCFCQNADGKPQTGSCLLSDEQICSGNCGKGCKMIEGSCNGSVEDCRCVKDSDTPPPSED